MKKFGKIELTVGRSMRFAGALLMLATFLCAPRAQGAGTVSPCTETSLRNVLKGGGTVTFGCSGTITLLATLNITANTTITTTGQSVTLSGGNAVGVIAVPAGVTVTLKNLTIEKGRTSSGQGGGISNAGTLTITNCNFGSPTGTAGTGNTNAIYNTGTLTISSSVFTLNVALNGGAIFHTGPGKLQVTSSHFNSNFAGSAGGAVVLESSTAEFNNTSFGENKAGIGGAIYAVFSNLTLNNSEFGGNSTNSGGSGGAIANLGSTVTVTGTLFAQNKAPNSDTAPGLGGAIYNAAQCCVRIGLFNFPKSPTLRINDGALPSGFQQNSAGDGGAIYSTGGGCFLNPCGMAGVANTTFSGNVASSSSSSTFGGHGGAIFNGGTAQLTVTGSTFQNDLAKVVSNCGEGTDIDNPQGPLSVANSTFAGSSAGSNCVRANGLFPSPIANLGSQTGPPNADVEYTTIVGPYDNPVLGFPEATTFDSTIIALNCNLTALGFVNYDIQVPVRPFFPTPCFFPSSANHSLTANPDLGPLANNGGLTETFALLTGSPAIEQIPFGTLDCGTLGTQGAVDQRGVSRPQVGECDMGSVEHLFGTVPPSGTACDGTYNKTFTGDITVSSGQNCVFVGGGITGNVRVTGGHFRLSHAAVGGNVEIKGYSAFEIGASANIAGNLEIHHVLAGAAANQVCGATVQNNLEVHNNDSAIQIGAVDTLTCPGNIIGGDLEAHNNDGATTVDENTVTGNLLDDNNLGSTEVFSNSVTADLQCQQDQTITGGTNTADQKSGQCADF